MIRYPIEMETKEIESIMQAINAGNICVGQRLFILNNSITCVHIYDNKRYIFSMDKIFITGPYNGIEDALVTVYSTGRFNEIVLFPREVIKNIDFLFVPPISRFEEGDKQFDWFKQGNVNKIKGDSKGFLMPYWTATTIPPSEEKANIIGSLGFSDENSITERRIGIPIFFQVTRRGKKL